MKSEPLTEADDDLRFYTTNQVAELLQVKVGTVRRWIEDGKLPGMKIDKRYRVRRSDLLAFVDERYGPK